MNIVFVGAGRLATNLALALKKKTKHRILQVYSHTLEAAEKLAGEVSAEATSELECLYEDADLYVVSVKDSVLGEVIGKLCNGKRNGLFVHTAGSIPMNIFKGHADRFGVFYPMQTFSKEKIVDFDDISTFVEANNEADLRMLCGLGAELCRNVYELSSEERKKLHLAAVFACNFANRCFAISAEILERSNIPFDVMLPLIDETTAKIHKLSPAEAQTGPAVRYDENVIRMQKQMLEDDPAACRVYEAMSWSIHEAAMKKAGNQNEMTK